VIGKIKKSGKSVDKFDEAFNAIIYGKKHNFSYFLQKNIESILNIFLAYYIQVTGWKMNQKY
jgi:hypothetical protein